MLTVSNVSKTYGGKKLFDDVTTTFDAGHRYGLTGANGAGKSTFMKILASELEPDQGSVTRPARSRLSMLHQDHYRYENERIRDVVVMGNPRLWQAMQDKEVLLAKGGEMTDDDGMRLADLEIIVGEEDGYSAETEAERLLTGLGIPTSMFDEPLSRLDSGMRLRVLVAQALFGNPDILLLDEPTNHLDILSIRWLEKFLMNFAGTAVVISHDHRFLDNVCTHIVDVDYATITLYKGNYAAFVEQKAGNRERKEAEIEKREKEIAHHQAFIDAFKAKATKARQAGSKQKLIDRMVIEQLPQSSRRYPNFRFQPKRPSGRMALDIQGLAKSYGEKKVLEDVSLTVRRGDRVAIIGPNGIGKSTLLKIAMGVTESDAGTIEWGYETYPGYFAQDHHELLGGDSQTVESWLWNICPQEPIGFVRGQLAAVLFTRDDVEKKLSALSGGEAARLVFARLAVEQPNVLVLDEPTNHLDLEAIDALIEGLKAYDGTLIFVSHDRWFVSQLATRIVEIKPDGIADFDGSYEEYLDRLGDDHLDADAVLMKARRDKKAAKERDVVRASRSDGETKALHKKLAGRRDQITADIDKSEARVNAINELFCDPTFFDKTPRAEVTKLENEQKQLREKAERLMAEWESVEAELQALVG